MSAFDSGAFDDAFDIDAPAALVTSTPATQSSNRIGRVHKGGRYSRRLFWLVLLLAPLGLA